VKIQPYRDIVTGDIRCWQIVDDDGLVIADGLATHFDAEGRARQIECKHPETENKFGGDTICRSCRVIVGNWRRTR